MEKYRVSRSKKGIVWFTINRPEIRNAIDFDIMEGLATTLAEVKDNPHDRVLVITGCDDKAFCSGGDLQAFHSLNTKELAYGMLSKMGEVLYNLCTLPKPTIALINGVAIGGGCELATACDYRLATTEGRVGFVQGKLGITTGFGGASMLFEKMPYDQALQMLLSAKMYSAIEVKNNGFIHELLPHENLHKECEHYIEHNLLHNIGVLQAYKKIAMTKWDTNKLKERMVEEIEQCATLWETDEHLNAVEQFIKNK